MKHQIIIAMLMIFAFSLSFAAQTSSMDVAVFVQANNKDLRDTTESYISRELRSLKDVNITTDNPFYEIYVLILENKTTSGRPTGYTAGVAITYNLPCTVFGKAQVCNTFETQRVYIDNVDSLRRMCEEIVTDFDAKNLKSLRTNRPKS